MLTFENEVKLTSKTPYIPTEELHWIYECIASQQEPCALRYRRMALLADSCDIHHRRLRLTPWHVMLPRLSDTRNGWLYQRIHVIILSVSQPSKQQSSVGVSEVTGPDVFLHDVAWGLMEHSLHILSSQVNTDMWKGCTMEGRMHTQMGILP
jgi:hypothetical protein